MLTDASVPNPPSLIDIRRRLAGAQIADPEQNAHAAVALVLAGASIDLSVCLILRAEHASDRWSGHVALPGGRIDPGDPSPREAAIRETREEVGLRLGHLSYLGSLKAQPIVRDGRPTDKLLCAYVFHLGEELEPLRPNREVAQAFWVPLQHLLDPRNAGYRPSTRAGVAYDSPAVLYQGHHIWGLTYRVLAAFFERLQLRIARPVS